MRYKWTLLRASQFLLDGGGMFGIIPRVVWERSVTPDDKHRIRLMHNCLLLESVDPDPETGKPHRYLIEAGTGDKLDEKMSSIFGLDGRTVESEVVRAGVDVGEIEATIVTHLHFDHAGGLTRRAREGETPDWVASKPGAASGDSNDVCFTFPNAELIVQRREWVDARNNDAVMTRTYYRDHLLPFEDERMPLADGRARLRVVDSARPFPLNRKPSKGEMPKSPVEERTTQVLPGIHVFLVPGHTWGQQAVQFEDDQGRTIVFTPDVLPTHYHIGQPYSLSYDVEPYTSMITKQWFLHEASERGWVLVLDHEPGNPCYSVKSNDKGWYDLEPVDCGIEPA
ncbi:MAG: MBL fold metallo-hydrolase [Phycisphaerales bacterium]|nr:MBL fold metallo-hydrolase [Phycisphaerales bacterium]